jgi:putative membrane protein
MLFLKGAGMGAADVVPGVSGGTIAFITGIYERLLTAIRRVNFSALKLLKNDGIKACWQYIDGSFLCAVFGGVMVSAVSLAKIITYLMAHYQMFVWSFFFGLIVASFVHIAKQLKNWDFKTVLACSFGAAIAFVITLITPAEADAQTWYYFFAGAIAICAMILPGISGSFILLLLGMYSHVLTAVTSFDFALIGLFLLGCMVGLMSFSHLLGWLLSRFKDMTFAVLAGFLLGSLNLLWPWKEVLSTYTNSKGIEKPLSQSNIGPYTYQLVTGQDPHTLACIGIALIGLLLILFIEKITSTEK